MAVDEGYHVNVKPWEVYKLPTYFTELPHLAVRSTFGDIEVSTEEYDKFEQIERETCSNMLQTTADYTIKGIVSFVYSAMDRGQRDRGTDSRQKTFQKRESRDCFIADLTFNRDGTDYYLPEQHLRTGIIRMVTTDE